MCNYNTYHWTQAQNHWSNACAHRSQDYNEHLQHCNNQTLSHMCRCGHRSSFLHSLYSFQLHYTHRQAMYSFQLHYTHIDRHCTHTDYITHGHCTHSLHHHCYHPLLLLSSSPCSKLMFSTNPFLHSSSTFPSTGPTPQTPAVFHFSQACQF